MRWATLLLALTTLSAAEEADPFRGKSRRLADPEGRVSILIGEAWRDLPLTGNTVIAVKATSADGGHHILVTREAGQGEVEKQRERYLVYDSAQMPNGTVQKIAEPFFGYRIDEESSNRVKIRAFVRDGEDGLVLSCVSRFTHYDKLYKAKIYTVAASLATSGGPTRATPATEGEEHRVHDPRGRVSLVVPGAWKIMPTEDDDEWLFVALKGAKSGPRILVRHWGGPASAGLTLTKVFARWKRTYSQVTSSRFATEPPAMLVRNRIPGSVDYLIGFEHRDAGLTMMLTVSQGSYERFKPLADEVAKTIVFAGAKWTPATPREREVQTSVRKHFVIHHKKEHAAAAKTASKLLGTFPKQWREVRLADGKKAPPIPVVIVGELEFPAASNYFGQAPATYDPSTRSVVVVTPPEDEERQRQWRGRLFASVARATLHRDEPVRTPSWLVNGIVMCMDAAGRTGEGPEAGHPALAERLELKTSTDAHRPFSELVKLDPSAFERADSPNDLAMAWGYTHLLSFGSGTPASVFKRWRKDLDKAKGEAPGIDFGKYDKVQADLKKHVQKLWGK